jgi:hypothetical protein
MRKATLIMFVVGSGLLALGNLPALAAGWGAAYQAPSPPKAQITQQEQIFPRVDGQVIAIDRTASPMLLTVQVMKGTTEHTLQVELTANTTVQQGLISRSPDALGIGDHIWLDYEQVNRSLIADAIGILNPPVAALGTEGPDIRTS